MTYPTDEETFDARATPEWIREGHLNAIQQFLKRIQDFLGYGGRLHDESGLVMPVGSIIVYTGLTAPSGWLLCDGKDYSRTAGGYVDLFAVIGTKYGAPSGFSFNVPDFRGYFLRGYSKIPTISFVPADVSLGGETIELADQEFNRSGLPVRFTTDDTLPAPFLINTTYWVVHGGGDLIRFATSRSNAVAGTYINITTVGAGTSYVHPYVEEDKDSRLKSAFGGNSGEDLGSYQPDENKDHYHNQAYGWVGLGAGDRWYDPDAFAGPGKVAPNTMWSGGFESRPRNVNVNYIIKR